jgi:hypothetical protein
MLRGYYGYIVGRLDNNTHRSEPGATLVKGSLVSFK